jgi:hypothetical protein
MESCAIVANQFSAQTHVWPWTQTHSYIKPAGAAGQLIRCHARRAAEAKPMSDRASLREVAALMASAGDHGWLRAPNSFLALAFALAPALGCRTVVDATASC